MYISSSKFDVIVIGSGPAALSLAASCGERGLRVATVSPDPTLKWLPTYSCWANEIKNTDIEDCIEARWASPLVFTSDTAVSLKRDYVKLSTSKLQSHLKAQCRRYDVEHIVGQVEAVNHATKSDTIVLSNGTSLCTQLCVDASGHSSPFTKRRSGVNSGWQMAYGQLIELAEPQDIDAKMVLMDYRIPTLCSSSQRNSYENKPSFLYLMPLSPNHIFVEETSLVARPRMSHEELKNRLEVRLESMKIRVKSIESVEYCAIQMGGGLPLQSQQLLSYGSAAGMVHPASGYLISRVLDQSEAFSHHIYDGVSQGTTPEVRRDLWGALWPSSRKRSWELYQFGMDVLCLLDHQEITSFYESFFKLDSFLCEGFLSATLPPKDIARTMFQFFLLAEPKLKRKLISSGFGPGRTQLIRSVIGA
jgi:lycopene cyclase-like protein